ncbi:MAG: carboxypeptidase regulatory-like domain-containing protein, partial [Lewinella sp.]|nr:carboxypeptidase regulatory-like domain-containing protein [Lewinella sp.]
MKRWFYLLAALPLLFTACRENVEEITVTGFTYQPPQVIVTADLSGQVVDANGDIVTGATVRIGSLATATDERGFFQFLDAQLNSRGTYVTVYKDGYFPGSTRFFPLNNSSNYVTIGLLDKTIAGSFSNAEGGTVTADGAQVSLPANGVARTNGTPYDGQVQVAVQWINPTADNLIEIMPGNLQGVSKDGQEVSMATFGMLAVELQDEAGNELQVAAGRTAELTFPVPAEIRANAPAE